MRFQFVVVAVLIAVVSAIGAYYYVFLHNASNPQSQSPSPSPIPSPTPIPIEEGYNPIYYWNTLSAQGFVKVEPLSASTRGGVEFTISRGKTGMAVLDFEVVKTWGPGFSNETDTFNVSFITRGLTSMPYDLPDWLIIDFDPANFTIGKSQKSQVKMLITTSPEAPNISMDVHLLTAYNPLGTDEARRVGLDFTLITTD